MPVTKTAKRALKVSKRKTSVNRRISSNLEIALKEARNKKSLKSIQAASSLADRAAKKGLIHKNKASRIKSALSKLLASKKKVQKKLAK